MNKTERACLFVLLICCFAINLALADAASKSRWSGKLPVLTVRDGAGSISYIKMGYERDKESSSPLAIAISEQSPQASGDMLRASIWQAAMVAAFERKDPLNGVKLSFELSEEIDGPSAGCLFTLGILSALDNRPYPGNVAVTGSILPDGTIGRVGGVNLKTMAAYEAGMKAIIIPAYLRLETAETVDLAVDLKQLAEVLGLKYLPVSSISEAYASLYGKKYLTESLSEELKLPNELELYQLEELSRLDRILISMFDEYAKLFSGEDKWSALIVPDIVNTYSRSCQAAQAGYFDVALELREHAWVQSRAFLRSRIELNDKDKLYSKEYKALENIEGSLGAFALAKGVKNAGLSSGGIEFLSQITEFNDTQCYLELYETAHQEAVAAIKPSGFFKSIKNSALDKLSGVNFVSTYIACSADFNRMLYTNAVVACDLALSYPCVYRYNASSAAHAICYSTLRASRNTLISARKAYCQDSGIDWKTYCWDLVWSNPDAASALSFYSDNLKNELPKQSAENRDYLATILSLASMRSIAEVSRMLAHDELGAAEDESGNIHYSNPALLHHMLRNARRNALQAVSECKKGGYPWVSAAMLVRSADFNRDSDTDKTEVLADYWQATLISRAMTILLQPDRSQKVWSRKPKSLGVKVVGISPEAQGSIKKLKEGDVIVSLGGIRVTSHLELTAILASMPKGKDYKVKFHRPADKNYYSVTAVGGKLLGIMCENYYYN